MIFFFFPPFQAFHDTIEIFQQKNESFKNALKDVEEVSVSVVPDFKTQAVSVCPRRHTECAFLFACRTQSWGSAPLAGFATTK